MAANVELKRGYTRCRYGALHYMIAGEDTGAAPPLLLLHQNPSSTFEYETLAREMATDRLVIAFDTPGNGMSDRPPEPATLVEYAACFGEGLDALALPVTGKVDVFGYHTGTYLAAELAIARPDLIGRVIMSGLPYRPAHERAEKLQAALNPPPLTEDGEGVFEFIRRQWSWTVAGRDPRVPLEHAVEQFAERVKPMHRGAWQYIGVWGYDAEDRLPRVTQPVLILQPHEALLEHSREAGKLMRDVKFVDMPDLDKDPLYVGADQFGREIRAWAARPA